MNDYANGSLSRRFSIFTYIVLQLVIVFRAIKVPITYDEAYTVEIARGTQSALIANNHWINTSLVKTIEQFAPVGDPFWIRLPNVLSFPFYFFVVWQFLKNSQSRYFQICASGLLLLNPFILEFFSLSRGYGLALGGFSVLIYQITVAPRSIRPLTNSVFISVALLFTFYSNFSTLIPLFASCVVYGTLVLQRLLHKRNRNYLPVILVGICTAGAMIPGIKFLRDLDNSNLLYYGGTSVLDTWKSFLQDTFSSLEMLSMVFQFSVFLTTVFVLSVLYVGARNSLNSSIFQIFLLSLIGQHFAFTFFGALYPISRTALVYILLLGLAALNVKSNLRKPVIKLGELGIKILMPITALIIVMNFVFWVNFSKTISWPNDEDSYRAAKMILSESLGEITWCKFSDLEPSINYYLTSQNVKVINSDCTNLIQGERYIVPRDFKLGGMKLIQQLPVTSEILSIYIAQ